MKSVPPAASSPATPARKGESVFPANEIIQKGKMSQDQRGVKRPVGNVKRKAPRPIHTRAERRLSRVERSGGDGVGAQTPKSVVLEPVAPKSASTSEANSPIL